MKSAKSSKPYWMNFTAKAGMAVFPRSASAGADEKQQPFRLPDEITEAEFEALLMSSRYRKTWRFAGCKNQESGGETRRRPTKQSQPKKRPQPGPGLGEAESRS